MKEGLARKKQSSFFSLAPIPGLPSVPLIAKDPICREAGVYTATLPRTVWLWQWGLSVWHPTASLRPWLPALLCWPHATVSFLLAGTWMIKFPALQPFFLFCLQVLSLGDYLNHTHSAMIDDSWVLHYPGRYKFLSWLFTQKETSDKCPTPRSHRWAIIAVMWLERYKAWN